MTRRTLLAVLTAVMVFAAHSASAQTTWDQYRAQLERNREAQARRYETWREQQQKMYEQRRAAPASDPGFRVDLRDSSVPPGDYVIQLPFGLKARVNVQTPDRTSPPPAWSASFYSQVAALAGRISDDLRDIRYGVRQTQHEQLQGAADEAFSGIAEVQRQALQRADGAQIRQEFQDFDQNWHRLASDLANQNYLNAGWIRQKAENITQNDHALHQILQVGEAPLYDRVRVAALTRQLSDAVEHLLEDVKLESRANPQLEVARRRAERARRLAADLEQAVVQDAPLATVVEEYQAFDEGWHRLMAVARDLPDVSGHLRRAAGQVREIDVELHRELRISTPIASGSAHIRNLADSVARQADHLAEDIRQAAGDRELDLVRMADDFAWSARSLHRALNESQRDEADAVQWVTRYWGALQQRLYQSKNDRLQHAREVTKALDPDVERLVALVQQNR